MPDHPVADMRRLIAEAIFREMVAQTIHSVVYDHTGSDSPPCPWTPEARAAMKFAEPGVAYDLTLVGGMEELDLLKVAEAVMRAYGALAAEGWAPWLDTDTGADEDGAP